VGFLNEIIDKCISFYNESCEGNCLLYEIIWPGLCLSHPTEVSGGYCSGLYTVKFAIISKSHLYELD